MRRLLATRRQVAAPATAAYLAAWAAVRRAVEGAGGRAWVFRSQEDGSTWLEFVEWQEEQEELEGQGERERPGVLDLPGLPGIEGARRELDGFGMGESELWREPREDGG